MYGRNCICEVSPISFVNGGVYQPVITGVWTVYTTGTVIVRWFRLLLWMVATISLWSLGFGRYIRQELWLWGESDPFCYRWRLSACDHWGLDGIYDRNCNCEVISTSFVNGGDYQPVIIGVWTVYTTGTVIVRWVWPLLLPVAAISLWSLGFGRYIRQELRLWGESDPFCYRLRLSACDHWGLDGMYDRNCDFEVSPTPSVTAGGYQPVITGVWTARTTETAIVSSVFYFSDLLA